MLRSAESLQRAVVGEDEAGSRRRQRARSRPAAQAPAVPRMWPAGRDRRTRASSLVPARTSLSLASSGPLQKIGSRCLAGLSQRGRSCIQRTRPSSRADRRQGLVERTARTASRRRVQGVSLPPTSRSHSRRPERRSSETSRPADADREHPAVVDDRQRADCREVELAAPPARGGQAVAPDQRAAFRPDRYELAGAESSHDEPVADRPALRRSGTVVLLEAA